MSDTLQFAQKWNSQYDKHTHNHHKSHIHKNYWDCTVRFNYVSFVLGFRLGSVDGEVQKVSQGHYAGLKKMTWNKALSKK